MYFEVFAKNNKVFNNKLTLLLMEVNTIVSRFEAAVNHLISLKLIDSKDVVKDITAKTGYHPNNVRAALRGEEKYLNRKFVKTFCASYGNILNVDWIWEGNGEMCLTDPMDNASELSRINIPENIETLEKPQLIYLLTNLVDTYNKILENNKILHEHLKVCEEIAKRDQENFKYLMTQISKHV